MSSQFEGESSTFQQTRILTPLQVHCDGPRGNLSETLAQRKPITCATSGVSFDAAPAPVAVFFDFYLLPQLQATRALSGHPAPVIAFAPIGCTGFLRNWGPESVGGRGDFGAQIDAEAQRTGKSPLEVGEEVYTLVSSLHAE
ncbi:hypothetical protein LshimejAT787_1100380 [Lyophyllum shimeji]|uniref:Uncharacterized protein n=1 Tax=Lyophyllum shimeji TaxID=47721 RepID=A0A9P3UQV7_LYOSH|nr:hypothetical protein LshimejAT787_1100380 [Lyophyllum shimeji]